MRYLLFFTFLFVSQLRAQNPISTEWVLNAGGVQYDHCSGMAYGDNCTYICGYFIGSMNGQPSQGSSDAFLAKYSEDGNLIWQKCFGGPSEDRAHQLYYDKNNGNIYLCGYFDGILYFGNDSLVTTGDEDIFLMAIDSSGNYLWGKSYGGAGTQSASTVFCDDSGKISISGYFEDTLNAGSVNLISRGIRNVFLLQTDTAGNCIWGKRMGGLLYDEGLNIVGDEHDNLYLSGYYRDTADFGPFQTRSVFTYDCFLVSLTSAGDWRWLKSFGGGYIDNCPALAYMPLSHKILTGGWFFNNISFGTDTTLYSSGEEESYLAAFDTLGNLSWSKRVGSEMAELIYDISVDENDNILVVGTYDSVIIIGLDTLRAKHYNRPTDVFALGFSPEGKYEWGFSAGGIYSDFGFHASWGDSSTIFLSGNFLNNTIFGSDSINSRGNYDIYLAKLKLDRQNIGPNSIITNETDFELSIYPNPATEYLMIENKSGQALGIIAIYDLKGKLLKIEKSFDNILRMDLSNLAPGAYLINYADNNSAKKTKMFFKSR